MSATHIHFVGRNLGRLWPDYASLTEADLMRDPDRFKGGTINWIFQTYLRLREALASAGHEVSFDESLLPGVINIAHRDSLNEWRVPYFRSYVVGVRADRPPVKMCDWEIVQNGIDYHGVRQSHIPHWPQPGLIARDPRRGARLEKAAYLGRIGTTSAWLRDPRFARELARLGVEFSIRETAWSDYSDVDLVIAHRVESPTMLRQKPASKLVNAWLAGVPALLNEEPAFRELRNSPLDYMAIDSANEVLAAITKLKGDPGLYQAMVENGRVRAGQFSVDAVRSIWLTRIEEVILPDAQRRLERSLQPVRALANQAARLLAQKALSRQFKLRYAAENRARRGYLAPAAARQALGAEGSQDH
jgi:hypothetical protein